MREIIASRVTPKRNLRLSLQQRAREMNLHPAIVSERMVTEKLKMKIRPMTSSTRSQPLLDGNETLEVVDQMTSSLNAIN
jgi:hypothetical protein